jgi:very-short-patch-repair endonuclease
MNYERSFASHIKSKFWSDKNTIKPENVSKYSHKKYFFNCDSCNHTFLCRLDNLVSNNSWCPYCSKPPKLLCDDKNYKNCFEKSFASHSKNIYWSNKNKLVPRQCFKISAKKYLFNCDKCTHIISILLANVSNNFWCCYCTNSKLCENKNYKECFIKSLASHPKNICFSDKNNIESWKLLLYSHKKYIFNCNVCNHEFLLALDKLMDGNWCSKCKHKTELKLYNWLLTNNIKAKTQVKFDWSKTDFSYLRYDYLLYNYRILIELDGPQHFKQISNWQSPEKNQINDDLKNTIAIQNNYHIIRICQKNVWKDEENWNINLLNIINLLINSNEYKLYKIGSIYNSI